MKRHGWIHVCRLPQGLTAVGEAQGLDGVERVLLANTPPLMGKQGDLGDDLVFLGIAYIAARSCGERSRVELLSSLVEAVVVAAVW
jgi:hypothetical protein